MSGEFFATCIQRVREATRAKKARQRRRAVRQSLEPICHNVWAFIWSTSYRIFVSFYLRLVPLQNNCIQLQLALFYVNLCSIPCGRSRTRLYMLPTGAHYLMVLFAARAVVLGVVDDMLHWDLPLYNSM
ncbi:hypothetical protein J3459_007775 [Metarhizium acridum]|uniref:uncharacterized protein n=1 Tax=Metarhizium acridum TaxID=92637 RepID=UPI001C6C84DB|nr:hypothetical protein J3458_019129 [Metarhizium acridum]KAG8426835.1 hypothetical protein J3459_007775 [Metarhizium acridum]